MEYIEPIFRPPSEAYSLIVQLTNGCAYNRCTFCPMYKSKQYRVFSRLEIISHLKYLQKIYPPDISRVFLADGDSLDLDTAQISASMDLIKQYFPKVRKFGIYGSVFSLQKKETAELKKLKEQG